MISIDTPERTISQYTARNFDRPDNRMFPKIGDKNHLFVIQLDKKIKTDNIDHYMSVPFGDFYHHAHTSHMYDFPGERNHKKRGIHYTNVSFARYQNNKNHSSTDYIYWERNQGILIATNKGNPNCHEKFGKDLMTVQETNNFTHSKMKQSINSNIHNYRPTKRHTK